MIPFELWPGSWGLRGKTKAIAKAEYELSGYELDVRLAEINNEDNLFGFKEALLAIDYKYNKLSAYDYEVKLNELVNENDSAKLTQQKLEIDFKHKKIDEYSYEKGLAEQITTAKDRNLKLIEVDLKFSRITDQEYEKRKADVLEEPWIAMPKISWDPVDPTKTYFELDYNDFFLNFLRDNGYQGSDDDCINRWLNDVCYSVLQDIEQPEPELVSTIRRIRLPDGKTEHS